MWKLFKGGNYMGKYSTYSFLKLQNLIDFNQDLQKRKEKKLSSDKAEKAVLKPQLCDVSKCIHVSMINISNVQKPLPPLSFLPRNKLKNTSTSWYATLLQIDFEYVHRSEHLFNIKARPSLNCCYWEILRQASIANIAQIVALVLLAISKITVELGSFLHYPVFYNHIQII